MSLHAAMQACRLGDVPALQSVFSPALLTATEPGTGWTPLYCAGVFGHAGALGYLLDQGADPDVPALSGDTLLHFAVASGQSRIATLLLDSGATPSPTNRDGDTPLHHACAKGDLKAVKLLLRFKADVGVANNGGRTALHCAVAGGHLPVVRVLTVNGASAFAEDSEGIRPVDLCKSQEMATCLVAESRKSTPSTFLLNPSPDPRDEASPCPVTTSPQSSTMSNPSPLPDLLEFRSLEEKIKRLESINKKIRETLRTSVSSPESSHRTNPRPARLSTPDTILRDDGRFLSWLAALRLESMYPALVDGGFDDLGQVCVQMRSGMPLTEELLEMIGVEKQGWRVVFLAALEREVLRTAQKPQPTSKRSKGQCCHSPTPTPSVLSFPSLPLWLDRLGLGYLLPHFEAAGYLEVEQLLFLMHSRYPVTDTVLQNNVGVEKVGHRHRILCKLREDAENFDVDNWPAWEKSGKVTEREEELETETGCAIA